MESSFSRLDRAFLLPYNFYAPWVTNLTHILEVVVGVDDGSPPVAWTQFQLLQTLKKCIQADEAWSFR